MIFFEGTFPSPFRAGRVTAAALTTQRYRRARGAIDPSHSLFASMNADTFTKLRVPGRDRRAGGSIVFRPFAGIFEEDATRSAC
jgi:hypothetical protein